MSGVVLYDLPTKGRCACWSLNPWKTRLALNFKGVDYKTEWVEYPDVASKLKSLGIPPNSGDTAYTIPAITLDAHTHLQDSDKIAPALEKAYPQPPLHLDSPILPQVGELLGQIAMPLVPLWMPAVPKNLLNPPSAEYFERTRSEKMGKSLSELAKDGTPETWDKVKEPVGKMVALLKKDGSGPFFMGKTVSYADFVLVSAIHFFRRVDEAYFEKFVGADPAFKEVYDACAKWLEKDN